MDFEIAQVAQTLTDVLSPALPHLVDVGKKVAEDAGKKLTAAALERAKAPIPRRRPGSSSETPGAGRCRSWLDKRAGRGLRFGYPVRRDRTRRGQARQGETPPCI